ncbi:MAG: hypothetical protein ACKOPQ_15345 [Novosphingobium sp.]
MAFVAALAVLASSASPVPAPLDADLLCASYAALIVSGATEEKKAAPFRTMMYYFVGRWEAATGKPIAEGMTASYLKSPGRISSAVGLCLPRMMEIGKRLSELDAVLEPKK